MLQYPSSLVCHTVCHKSGQVEQTGHLASRPRCPQTGFAGAGEGCWRLPQGATSGGVGGSAPPAISLRPIAGGSAGGAIIWALLRTAARFAVDPHSQISQPLVQEVCALPNSYFFEWRDLVGDSLSYSSFLLGLCVGIFVGPCIDVVFLLRALWSRKINSCTRRLLRPQAQPLLRPTHLPIT